MGDEALLLAAAGVLAFWFLKKRGLRVPVGTRPASTGVMGTTAASNPAAPLSTGDFARMDRLSPVSQVGYTTGDFARMDRTADASPAETTGDFARYDRAASTWDDEVPAVIPTYDPYARGSA